MSQVKPILKLDWCSHEAAKYAVEHWHYSKCMPKSKLVKIGVWEDNAFIGAVVFGSGANNNMLKPYGLTIQEGCELVRVALKNHKATVTKIISIAIMKLKQQSPKLRLIVSFADNRQNHLGTIYQAGNWVYTGSLESTPEYLIKGKWWHQRALNSSYGSIKKAPFTDTRKGGFRFRYLYPLDSEMREQIEKLRKPYPKSLCDTIVSASSNTIREEAGLRPTVSLQN